MTYCIDQDNSGTLQLKDSIPEGVTMNNVPQESDTDKQFPHLARNNDLFFRVAKINREIDEQLLVPKLYRRMVLDLAQDTEENSSKVLLVRGTYEGEELQISTSMSHFPSPLFHSPSIRSLGKELVWI